MAEQMAVDKDAAFYSMINRIFSHFCTFLMAAAASLVITMSSYVEALHDTRIAVFLIALILLHLLWHSRFLWQREFSLYACLVGYMFIALLWTQDVELAANTLVPAINFILIMIVFGSLIKFHNVSSVLAGALFGFAAGAALYTVTVGFPFTYPKEFSYNAIASMYLFGLFVALMYNSCRRSHSLILMVVAIVIMLHIVATTSIKANLGVALGLTAAGIMYFRHFGQLLRRRVLMLILVVGAMGLAIASNDALVDAIFRGGQRVSIGLNVLQAREDVSGYTGFEERGYWKQVGIDGWRLNPVFGYGTEAFRKDYGITSHSTPIDLLYNYGLVGLGLFYGVFASLIWRLLQLTDRGLSGQRSLILGGVVCYVFVSLSGTMHYNIFLAAFVGISAALLTLNDRAATSRSASMVLGAARQ